MSDRRISIKRAWELMIELTFESGNSCVLASSPGFDRPLFWSIRTGLRFPMLAVAHRLSFVI